MYDLSVLHALSLGEWAMLAIAAGCVGFAKTAIGGIGMVAVALFAVVLPARESTGALLPLLIAGDVVAVTAYRRHASRRTVLALLPGVVPGLFLGALFLAAVGDATLRLVLASTLLVLTGWQLVLRLRSGPTVVTPRNASAKCRPRRSIRVGLSSSCPVENMEKT